MPLPGQAAAGCLPARPQEEGAFVPGPRKVRTEAIAWPGPVQGEFYLGWQSLPLPPTPKAGSEDFPLPPTPPSPLPGPSRWGGPFRLKRGSSILNCSVQGPWLRPGLQEEATWSPGPFLLARPQSRWSRAGFPGQVALGLGAVGSSSDEVFGKKPSGQGAGHVSPQPASASHLPTASAPPVPPCPSHELGQLQHSRLHAGSAAR